MNRTTRILAVLLLGVASCRLPDTFGIGFIDGSLSGTSTATLEAFGGPTNFEAETDMDNRAIVAFAAWSMGYTETKRNGRRLERIERALIAMQLRAEGVKPCR